MKKKKRSLDSGNNRIIRNTNILIYGHSISFFAELRVVVIVVRDVYVDRSSEKREKLKYISIKLFCWNILLPHIS